MDVSTLKRKMLGFEKELRGEFSPEDVSMLQEDLRSLGVHAWLNWLFDHDAQLLSLASSAQGQRLDALRAIDPVIRRRLLLGALGCTLQSIRFFDVLEQANFDQNAPPLGLISAASMAYEEIRHGDHVPYWPFPEGFPFDE